MAIISIVLAFVFGFIVCYLTSDVVRRFISAYREKKSDEEKEKEVQ
jgi:Na+-transporting methylmalonyl-CoA/oxaloacetate decarboxylase gamma subunit